MWNMEELEKVFDFIIEIEKLKDVHRKTRPVGLDRFENSAEHSWHVCISALMLKDYANDAINIDRVIKMLLIHDLGEIDADDVIIYQSETPEQKENEAKGVKRLLSYLPEEKQKKFLNLWYEFEEGVTPDAKYAKAIDRVPPLLHNLHGDGHSWKAHKVTKEMVFNVNKRIEQGSKVIWGLIKNKLEAAEEQGLFTRS